MLLLAGLMGTWGCSSTPPPGLPIAGHFSVARDALNGVQRALAIGDCNGDGLLDMVSMADEQPAILYIRRSDGSLDPNTINLRQQANAAEFVDLDGDGNQDLLLAANQVFFFRGHGDCTFDPFYPLTPPEEARIAQITVTDVDLDGLPDLAVTHFGMTNTPAELYLGQGDGTFVSTPLPVTPFSPTSSWLPWGTFWDDLDGDGVRDFVAVFDDAAGWISFGVPGDMPTFQRSDQATAMFAPEGPMELAPIDYDRDGQMEYYISRQSNSGLLLKFKGRQVVNLARSARLIESGVSELWGAFSFDADFDGWPDLLVLQLDAASFPGPMQFFHNNHDGTFSPATKSVLNVDLAALYLLCGDILSNGHVVCYAVPLKASPVAVTNNLVPQGNWIGIHLRGTVSSPEAEGARVSLSGANPPELMYYGAQAPPTAAHDRGLLMAVGQQTSADVDIVWPSGIHQHVSGLPVGAYTTIKEPQVLTVSRRIAKANGRDTVDIVVEPGLNGSDGGVTIERTGGGVWTSYISDVAGKWQRTLIAPTTPGSVRIQVTIGGQPLLVRPRIIFR